MYSVVLSCWYKGIESNGTKSKYKPLKNELIYPTNLSFAISCEWERKLEGSIIKLWSCAWDEEMKFVLFFLINSKSSLKPAFDSNNSL